MNSESASFNFCGKPVSVANIPYAAACLLKLHGRICTIIDPFDPTQNTVWEIVQRIGSLFSIILVYPALGILTLVASISKTFNAKKEESNSLNEVALEDLKKAEDYLSSIDLKNRYYWIARIVTIPDQPSGYDYIFCLNHVAPDEQVYNEGLKKVKVYINEKLGKFNPKKYRYKFEFIIAEKESTDDFNIYAYEQTIDYNCQRTKQDGGPHILH